MLPCKSDPGELIITVGLINDGCEWEFQTTGYIGN
jgi:hypothetical protein